MSYNAIMMNNNVDFHGRLTKLGEGGGEGNIISIGLSFGIKNVN
jgi:hypothetical protein